MANPPYLTAVVLFSAGAVACIHSARATPPATAAASDAPASTAPTTDRHPGDIHVAGTFAPEDVTAIAALINRQDTLPLLSIEKQGDEVRAMTGSASREFGGGGNMWILRKVNGRWTVVDRGVWAS
jgi:hypothetical protein